MSKTFTKSFTPLPWGATPQDLTGENNLGISTNDAVQRHAYGTRVMGWDGSVWKYAKNGSTVFTSYQAAVFHGATAAGISFEAVNADSPIGSREVNIAEASITEDQYAGGQLLLFHTPGNGSLYGVVGNTASAGGVVIVYLDRPLAVAILTTNTALELYASPYADVQQGSSNGLNGYLGIPMALLTASYFGWIKTWGPVFISAQSGIGGAYVKAGYFRHDGSIDIRGNIGSPVTDQYAGFVMVGSASGDGPLFMLQVSI